MICARAAAPSVADLDAQARAAGNRIDVAKKIGDGVFALQWPVQISQISANQTGAHLIVGIRLWGVKFHHPITRDDFTSEVAALVEQSFATAPQAEEVDVWASVPIAVGKGIVVNGDLAAPTSRTVFTVAARRGVSREDVFWDPHWTAQAFLKQRTGETRH